MATGSTANIAFALTEIAASIGPGRMSPIERLALLLVAEKFASGACLIEVRHFHALFGTDDPSEARLAFERLARRGLILLSDWRDDTAFAGSTLADDIEIGRARRAVNCDYAFKDWTG